MKVFSIMAAAVVCLTVGPLPAQEPAEAAQKDKRLHALMVGDDAPRLAVQEWVKGEPVEMLQGDVHVVEFWATWCGPCIAGMPHLSELQQRHDDAGLRILGINIWDDPANVAPFLAKEIPMHGKTGAEVMAYTVGIEQKDDPDDVRNGVMAREWMKAAGRDGIPSAFIVDRTGKIAWIGHPSGMDRVLAEVLAGKHDLKAAAAAYARRLAAEPKIRKFHQLFGEERYEEAYAVGHELVAGALRDDEQALNTLAWRIVDPDATPGKQDLDLALAAALRATELTKDEDAAILDTVAAVYHARKDLDKALHYQRLADKFAAGTQFVEEIARRLAQYEKEAAAKGEAGADKGGKEQGKGEKGGDR